MKTLTLALGLVAAVSLAARAEDKKFDLSGKYTLVSGKLNGRDADERVKKAAYTVTADTFVVEGGVKFVFSYKLKADATPVQIDLSTVEGPDGSKGTAAVGIVELKGDTLKIAYSLDKDKRPKNFDGKEGYAYELKKQKAK